MSKILDHIIAACVIVMVITISVSLIPFGAAFVLWDFSIIHAFGPAAVRAGLVLGFVFCIPAITSVALRGVK